MKKILICIIIAAALVVTGIGLFTVAVIKNGGNTDGFSSVDYETREINISDDFESIMISSEEARIKFIRSSEKNCRIVYTERSFYDFKAYVSNGMLIIEPQNNGKWYETISFSLEKAQITIYLPKSEYDTFNIKTVTGDVEIPNDFSLQTIKIEGSTSSIDCKASAALLTSIKVETGGIDLESVNSDSICLSVTTGTTNLKDINCTYLSSEGSTGKLEMKNVVAAGEVRITRKTGDVEFENCDGNEIYITTQTGNVKGNFLTEKIYTVETKTGKVSVPESRGENKCVIKTETGGVAIK